MDYPVIFIPGLFGSLGDDIIKGTGKLSFGFAKYVYMPFIRILNSMGYVEGKNLFISFYNWRLPVIEAVQKYLVPVVEKAKRETGMDKVILIGHSLGGLLGRTYISYIDGDSVDKLIMISPVNSGSVNAYCFWSGGKLPYPKVENNIIYNALKLLFILYYYLFEKVHYIEGLRDLFPICQDLLPSFDYGDYLFIEKDNKRISIPQDEMTVKNTFLNELNKISISHQNIYIIYGTGFETNKEFVVDFKREGIKWRDGKPIKAITTFEGDGTVTTKSALGNFRSSKIEIRANHSDILYESKAYLSNILQKPLKEVEPTKVEKAFIILAENCKGIRIETDSVNEILLSGVTISDDRVEGVMLPENRFLAMVAGDSKLDIKLDISPLEKPQVFMALVDKEGYNFKSNILQWEAIFDNI